MNKRTFLDSLMAGLDALSDDERQHVAEYYMELIMDSIESGKSEEEVVASFGDPSEIARQIIDERGSLQSRADEAEKRAENKQEAPREQNGLREYKAEGAVDTIVVETRDRRVEVRESEDGQTRVWFCPCEGDRVSVEETSGVFRFLHKASFFTASGWLWWSGIDRRLILEVPHGFTGTVCVKTSNSRIEAKGLYGRAALQLVSSNGTIRLEDSTCETLAVKTTNGGITLETLTGASCKGATTNGGLNAKNCRFDERLWLETTNGRVSVEEVEAPDLSFRTTNGPIRGTVMGREEEYAVTTHTSNAKSNLTNSSGDGRTKRLAAHTSNGGIHIEFTDDPVPDEEKKTRGQTWGFADVVGDDVRAAARKMGEQARAVGGEMGKELRDSMNAFGEEMRRSFGPLAHDIRDAVNEVVGEIHDSLQRSTEEWGSAQEEQEAMQEEQEALQEEWEDAQEEWEDAQEEWEEAQSGWEEAQAGWEEAQKAWEQAQQYEDEEIVEEARQDWEEAKADWEHAQQDIEQAKRDWEQAQRDKEQAQRDWEEARRERQDAAPEMHMEAREQEWEQTAREAEAREQEWEQAAEDAEQGERLHGNGTEGGEREPDMGGDESGDIQYGGIHIHNAGDTITVRSGGQTFTVETSGHSTFTINGTTIHVENGRIRIDETDAQN